MQTGAGYLLEHDGKDVGVILTIPSTRRDDSGEPRRVVNLSSWYIDPDHRWRAPRMLQTVTACNATLFTDLTATPSVRNMIGRLGFRGWTEGMQLMVVGERTRFWIPENLANKGEAGSPRGMLVFEIDLISIE